MGNFKEIAELRIQAEVDPELRDEATSILALVERTGGHVVVAGAHNSQLNVRWASGLSYSVPMAHLAHKDLVLLYALSTGDAVDSIYWFN